MRSPKALELAGQRASRHQIAQPPTPTPGNFTTFCCSAPGRKVLLVSADLGKAPNRAAPARHDGGTARHEEGRSMTRYQNGTWVHAQSE